MTIDCIVGTHNRLSWKSGCRRQRSWRAMAMLMVFCPLTSGCDPVSLTVLGVGSAAGVQHTLNGISYRTFTAPLAAVHAATVSALNRMGIKDPVRSKTEQGEIITAKAAGREIEIELDSITPKTTRMRTTVRNGLLMDSATGTEIIVQTERVLNNERALINRKETAS
jgi:hypothetical protein